MRTWSIIDITMMLSHYKRQKSPTVTPSPMVRPPGLLSTMAEPPNQQSLPMVIWCANSGPARQIAL